MATLKEGELTKKGAIMPSWKRRTFMLQEGPKMTYWASKEDAKPKGTIDLTDCFVVSLSWKDTADKFYFDLGTAAGRVYHIFADSKEARSEWVAAIQPFTRKVPRAIIAGAPASGKGTQCEIIVASLGLVHLSTGDMLRAAVAKGSKVGKEAQKFMEAGELVPDSVIIGVVLERLAQKDCLTKGYLLDGFPRTEAQAIAMEDAGIVINKFLLLDVPEETLIRRVVGRRMDPKTKKIYHLEFNPPPEGTDVSKLIHRPDDTEEKARVRLDTYNKNLEAILSHYKDIMLRVDGSTKAQDIFDNHAKPYLTS